MKRYLQLLIRTTGGVVLFATVLLSNAVYAEEITFEFTASVTTVIDPMGLSGLQVGNQIDGTYTFEDTTIGRNLTVNNIRYDNAVTDAQINLGNLQLSGIVASTFLNDNRIDVGDGRDFGNGNIQDIYDVGGLKLNPLSICATARGVGGFLLRANSPSNFVTGTAIPTTPPDISLADRLNTTTFQACQGAPEEVVVVGMITSLELATSAPVLSCVGFEPPMANYPVKAKKNRAFPLKMELFDDGFELGDNDLIAPPVVQVIFSPASGGPAVDVSDDVLSSGQASEGNQFVFTDDGIWQFNLKSSNYSAEGEYLVTAVSGDESEYTIAPSCVTSFVIE